MVDGGVVGFMRGARGWTGPVRGGGIRRFLKSGGGSVLGAGFWCWRFDGDEGEFGVGR